ncbi:MAG: DUF6266 family protein [Bacteroidota bacterium]
MKKSNQLLTPLQRVCMFTVALMFGAIFGMCLGIDPLIAGYVWAFISILLPLPRPSSTLHTVTQNPLIGRAKNKAGGMVFTTWKGKNVIKTKPLTVAQPPSDTRTMQQSIIRQLVAIGRPILGAIRKAFKEVSTGSTEWASFVKYNAPEAFDTSFPPTAALRPDQMTFAKGTLINPSDLAGVLTLRVMAISWTDNSAVSGNSATDQLSCVAITAAGEEYLFENEAMRSDGTASITIPGATTIGNFVIYAFFTTPSGSKAGDSVLLT